MGETPENSESAERALNEAAYRRLRDFIRENYPRGRFVGIAGGKIVGDAGSFRELHETLNQMGFRSPHNFIVEAGVEYPEFMIILSLGRHDESAISSSAGMPIGFGFDL